MADDDPPRAGPPSAQPGWPHRPADLGDPSPGRGVQRPPWAERPQEPAPPLRNLSGAAPPPPPRDRRKLAVAAVAVAVLLVGAVSVGVLASRGGDGGDEGAGGRSTSSRATDTTGRLGSPTPGVGQPPPTGTGTELTLLAGKVVVAARPGWEGLETSENSASVRLALRGPNGRELLSTLTIATVSGPESFDTILKLDGGTSFEVKGTDGSLRVTAQPGPAARIVAGAARPKAAFFLNISIFALDNSELDVPTLRTLFTDQVAPALRFP